MKVDIAIKILGDLLAVVAEEGVRLSFLLREDFELLFNGRPRTTAPAESIATAVSTLIESGVLQMNGQTQFRYPPETVHRVMDLAHQKKISDEAIRFTEFGGAAWEHLTNVDWELYTKLEANEVDGIWTIGIQSTSEKGICSYLDKINFEKSEARIVDFGRLTDPWKPVYWKTVNSGFSAVITATSSVCGYRFRPGYDY